MNDFNYNQINKGNISNYLLPTYGIDIHKGDHKDHAYLRKEGHKYIYHDDVVRTPKGFGNVTSINRHPIDIHHIKEVKVNVNGEEHSFHPDDIETKVHSFNQEEKEAFNHLYNLAEDLKMYSYSPSDYETMFKFDYKKNPSRVLQNYKNRLTQKHGMILSEEQKAKMNKIIKLGELLSPAFDKLNKFDNDLHDQRHKNSQKNLNLNTKDHGSLD